jgi:hypothetical protein
VAWGPAGLRAIAFLAHGWLFLLRPVELMDQMNVAAEMVNDAEPITRIRTDGAQQK